MNSDHVFSPEYQQTPSMDVLKFRKPYRRPELEVLGDLRTMTLGMSPAGTKDSSGGFLYEKIGDLRIPDFPPLPGEFPQPGDPYIPPL